MLLFSQGVGLSGGGVCIESLHCHLVIESDTAPVIGPGQGPTEFQAGQQEDKHVGRTAFNRDTRQATFPRRHPVAGWEACHYM